jgi:hypothetical protein
VFEEGSMVGFLYGMEWMESRDQVASEASRKRAAASSPAAVMPPSMAMTWPVQGGDDARHLMGRAVAPLGNALEQRGARGGRMHGGHQRCLDRARRDRVHADPGLGQLDGHHLGQRDEPALGGAVGAAPRVAHQARGRGDVDDGAAALRGHPARRGARDDEGADQVDLQHLAEGARGRVEEGNLRADAGRLHQARDAAEARLRAFEHALDLGLVGDVAGHEAGEVQRQVRAVAQRIDGPSVGIGHDHALPALPQQLDGGQADAGGTAGHDRGAFGFRLMVHYVYLLWDRLVRDSPVSPQWKHYLE